MKNFILLKILIITSNINLFPQNYNCNCDNNYQQLIDFEKKLSGRIFISTSISFKDQFFHKWAKGDIIMPDGGVIKNKLIRYNRYHDELIWLREPDFKTVIVDKETVSEFIIYDEENIPFAHFKKVRIKNWYESDSIDVFFQILTEGYISLYVLRKVILITNRNELYDKNEYYLFKENMYQKIEPNRLSLLRSFSANKPALRQILRKNRLKVKYEPQLIKAIELFNKDFGYK